VSRLLALLPPRGQAFAFLGLGSNVGERLDHLQRAVDLLDDDPLTRVDAVSSVYETEPVGKPEQGPYLNLALRVATRRSPSGLLALANRVEAALGRVREERWGPRTIDVDVLLYGERVIRTPRLQVPHPRLAERAFVLVPLMEVAPGLRLPGGDTAATALARLAPVRGVSMIGTQVTGPHGRPAR
jgi:2-amino-4-hydroxy-6-hydroxymethyldihydropteridine diphosphokinase